MRRLFSIILAAASVASSSSSSALTSSGIMKWNIVWVGGQSNSVGTNSQTSGYPNWPLNPRIQMFCWNAQHGCTTGSFAQAAYPIYGESNVGFSLTFANLLMQSLPDDEGVLLLNTGVGGTGFHDGNWVPPNGKLAVQSVNAVAMMVNAIQMNPGVNYTYNSLLWHQGEEDSGDNGDKYHADYCTYLINDLTALVDFFRSRFPGATNSTPFIDGGLLPYWQDNVAGGTGQVPDAIYALNTSRACTGTADSRVFPDFNPDGTPAGDPNYRSGVSGMVIHFDATQATFLGFEYWRAYLRSMSLTKVVDSSRTSNCAGSIPQPPVTRCG